MGRRKAHGQESTVRSYKLNFDCRIIGEKRYQWLPALTGRLESRSRIVVGAS